MGNKPSTFKKSDKRIGNFIMSKYGSELQYIKVRASSGHWSETYRSDNEFYKLLDEYLKSQDKDVEKYLHTLFIAHMIVCNGAKDWQFMEDIYKAHNAMANRLSPPKEINEEENQRIIQEEKEKYENK